MGSTDSSGLLGARARIDRIDDRICRLLRERAEIVECVAAAKRRAGEEGRSAFRPEREAAVLRRLWAQAKADGGPSFEGLARVWREIMSSALLQQEPVEVGVPGGTRARELRALARNHFGGGAKLETFPGMGALYRAVRDNPALLGLAPDARRYQRSAALDANPPRIFAALPFWGARVPSAYAFGHVRLAASGDDFTLVHLRLRGRVGLVSLVMQLTAHGLAVAVEELPARAAILQVEGFWADEAGEARLDAALAGGVRDWRLLGACARPLGVLPGENAQ